MEKSKKIRRASIATLLFLVFLSASMCIYPYLETKYDLIFTHSLPVSEVFYRQLDQEVIGNLLKIFREWLPAD